LVLGIRLTTKTEVFKALEPVQDPEHPISITDPRMAIVTEDYIEVEDGTIRVQFKPTVPYCPMGGLIGILIRHKLEEVYPDADVKVELLPGSHSQEEAVNSMISDNAKYQNVVQQLKQRNML
jgi:metal-sulfur cluster biosynthetic enzyme